MVLLLLLAQLLGELQDRKRNLVGVWFVTVERPDADAPPLAVTWADSAT